MIHLSKSNFKHIRYFSLFIILATMLLPIELLGHGGIGLENLNEKRQIQFPDTANHRTLVTDLHTHSVFSDGHVWPNIRVEEAVRDGLDVIAITEHLEFQPHRSDILHPDRNRAYEEALNSKQDARILIVNGAEITRDLPAGHINAVFLEDANKLISVKYPPTDPKDIFGFYSRAAEWPAQAAINAAHKQKAFLFLNHLWWERQTPTGISALSDFHLNNIKNGKLHGIEIANGPHFSEEALSIGLKYNLTLLGVSDVHNLIDWDYKTNAGEHRPVTLVFASKLTTDSVKEALLEGRTVVWFKNLLVGTNKHMIPLLKASITASSEGYQKDTVLAKITLTNKSDASFELVNRSDFTFMETNNLIVIPPHGKINLLVKTKKKLNRLPLVFEVRNALITPDRHPEIHFDIQLTQL